jgi:hypothetical protein
MTSPPDLQTWLIAQISAKPSLETLFTGFCKKLVRQGLPIWRSQIGLETLHPEDIGFSFLWIDGALQERSRPGRASSPAATISTAPPSMSTTPARPSTGGPARTIAAWSCCRISPPRAPPTT